MFENWLAQNLVITRSWLDDQSDSEESVESNQSRIGIYNLVDVENSVEKTRTHRSCYDDSL